MTDVFVEDEVVTQEISDEKTEFIAAVPHQWWSVQDSTRTVVYKSQDGFPCFLIPLKVKRDHTLCLLSMDPAFTPTAEQTVFAIFNDRAHQQVSWATKTLGFCQQYTCRVHVYYSDVHIKTDSIDTHPCLFVSLAYLNQTVFGDTRLVAPVLPIVMEPPAVVPLEPIEATPPPAAILIEAPHVVVLPPPVDVSTPITVATAVNDEEEAKTPACVFEDIFLDDESCAATQPLVQDEDPPMKTVDSKEVVPVFEEITIDTCALHRYEAETASTNPTTPLVDDAKENLVDDDVDDDQRVHDDYCSCSKCQRRHVHETTIESMSLGESRREPTATAKAAASVPVLATKKKTKDNNNRLNEDDVKRLLKAATVPNLHPLMKPSISSLRLRATAEYYHIPAAMPSMPSTTFSASSTTAASDTVSSTNDAAAEAKQQPDAPGVQDANERDATDTGPLDKLSEMKLLTVDEKTLLKPLVIRPSTEDPHAKWTCHVRIVHVSELKSFNNSSSNDRENGKPGIRYMAVDASGLELSLDTSMEFKPRLRVHNLYTLEGTRNAINFHIPKKDSGVIHHTCTGWMCYINLRKVKSIKSYTENCHLSHRIPIDSVWRVGGLRHVCSGDPKSRISIVAFVHGAPMVQEGKFIKYKLYDHDFVCVSLTIWMNNNPSAASSSARLFEHTPYIFHNVEINDFDTRSLSSRFDTRIHACSPLENKQQYYYAATDRLTRLFRWKDHAIQEQLVERRLGSLSTSDSLYALTIPSCARLRTVKVLRSSLLTPDFLSSSSSSTLSSSSSSSSKKPAQITAADRLVLGTIAQLTELRPKESGAPNQMLVLGTVVRLLHNVSDPAENPSYFGCTERDCRKKLNPIKENGVDYGVCPNRHSILWAKAKLYYNVRFQITDFTGTSIPLTALNPGFVLFDGQSAKALYESSLEFPPSRYAASLESPINRTFLMQIECKASNPEFSHLRPVTSMMLSATTTSTSMMMHSPHGDLMVTGIWNPTIQHESVIMERLYKNIQLSSQRLMDNLHWTPWKTKKLFIALQAIEKDMAAASSKTMTIATTTPTTTETTT